MNQNWMTELRRRTAERDDNAGAEHDNFGRRRRRNMHEGENLAAARRRWKEENRCRDCGADLEGSAGTGRRCDGCRQGAGRRKGKKDAEARRRWQRQITGAHMTPKG